jgi:short-subunit dehydrogenase
MKHAIVIGGTSGIGEGVAKKLEQNNYKVLVTGVEKDLIETINSKSNTNFTALFLDCMTENNFSNNIQTIISNFGGLDLLIFSAGIGNLNKDIGFTVENKANKLNILAFNEIIDWSYRFFEKQGHGHLVSVSSISGLIGHRIAPAYHAAKAYQISYTQALRQKAFRARKQGKKVYVTDVRPGFVDTPMTQNQGKKMFWLASQEKAAKQIYRLIERKKSYGYITKRWQVLAGLGKLLPTWLRNRL